MADRDLCVEVQRYLASTKLLANKSAIRDTHPPDTPSMYKNVHMSHLTHCVQCESDIPLIHAVLMRESCVLRHGVAAV